MPRDVLCDHHLNHNALVQTCYGAIVLGKGGKLEGAIALNLSSGIDSEFFRLELNVSNDDGSARLKLDFAYDGVRGGI